MIRRIIDGYESYECSRCGEVCSEDDDYCQICGHSFTSIRNEIEMEDNAEEGETICVVVGTQRSGIFTFTQIKKDITPKSVLNLPSFQAIRLMAEPNSYEFYVLRTDKYPYLSPGTQINLQLDHYESFGTSNGYTIYFDHRHFSPLDIIELKTYKFD